MVFGSSIAGYSGALSRKVYLVLFVVLMAVAATGVYLRQRAKATAALRQSSGQAAGCDTPAPPPKPTTPPPKLPGFAIEPACGTGAETPRTPPKGKAK
jgi:hypothetical protein